MASDAQTPTTIARNAGRGIRQLNSMPELASAIPSRPMQSAPGMARSCGKKMQPATTTTELNTTPEIAVVHPSQGRIVEAPSGAPANLPTHADANTNAAAGYAGK